MHYSHRLCLSAPLISSAAILNLTVHTETLQSEDTFKVPPELPLSRQDAPSGPTVKDFTDFHFNNRIDVPSLGRSSVNRDPDWYRLVSCYDPRFKVNPLRGVVYPLGSLSGSWAGRWMGVDHTLYTSILAGRSSAASAGVGHTPLYWDLQEHHCIFPNEPLSLGLDDAEEDDILHAFIPRNSHFTFTDEAVLVHDPYTGQKARYETFFPDSAARYSKAVCENVHGVWISDNFDGEIAGQSSQSANNMASQSSCTPSSLYIDDDDEYSDTASHLSSGVSDILITGKVSERYALAWGDYSIYGRVRSWDGLVVLYRFPSDPTDTRLGRWIFKGYIHDRNFVGRWRETSTVKDQIGYEGGFVVTKTNPVEN